MTQDYVRSARPSRKRKPASRSGSTRRAAPPAFPIVRVVLAAALVIRFAAPDYPGETLITEIWRVPGDGKQYQLRARVAERDKVVLSHGFAELA